VCSSDLLSKTLDEFKRLCDDTIILCNNTTVKENALILSYGFKIVKDDREWGKFQNILKEDFVRNHVSKLNPDITICLDMDETFTEHLQREDFIKMFRHGHSLYFLIVNLWDEGWNKEWSFPNIRAWSWEMKDTLGDSFFNFRSKSLHCGLAPEWAYHHASSTQFPVIHYGLKDESIRQSKVERYKKYDPEAKFMKKEYYEMLTGSKSIPLDIDDIIKQNSKKVDIYKQKKKQINTNTMNKEHVTLERLKLVHGNIISFGEVDGIPIMINSSDRL
jgi:hypothetical protein